MKCVVTGATGHIGNVLVRYLLDKGYEVRSLILNEKEKDCYIRLNIILLEYINEAFEKGE